jgi:iron complex transport system ATP-binding protein
MSTAPLLEINNVTAFQGSTRVFDNLNLTIGQGENVAILGPNGAGKSTLLKLLTRDIYPVVRDHSFVRINGSETVNVRELRQHIGFVSHDLQNQYANVLATGYDSVLSGFFGAVGMIYSHYPITDGHRQRAQTVIDELHLQPLQERLFMHLSTGQQRRFLLARAMIHQPSTLILDEPTNSLDIQATFGLIAHLREQVQQGVAVIIATHHIHEILPEINRLILLKEGVIVADGDKAALLTSNTLSELYETPIAVVEHNGFYQAFPAR